MSFEQQIYHFTCHEWDLRSFFCRHFERVPKSEKVVSGGCYRTRQKVIFAVA
jgi:hypothetical protein